MGDNKNDGGKNGGKEAGKVQNSGNERSVDWSQGQTKHTYRPANDNSGTPPPKDKKD